MYFDLSLEPKQHIRAYIRGSFISKFDIICHHKTYLNSETLSDEGNLRIPGSDVIRKDHPSDGKCDRIFVYYKKSLPFKVINVKLFT